MAANDSIELSGLDRWQGLRPGMTRADACSVVEAAGEKFVLDRASPDLVTISAWGIELRFEEGGGQELRQIGIENGDATWNGHALLDEPLYTALAAFGPLAQQAKWRLEDAFNSPFEDLRPVAAGNVSDEALLSDGTVWIPSAGVALTLYDGLVGEVIWRQPADVPKEFAGPVTEAQARLSMQPDWQNSVSRADSTFPNQQLSKPGWNAAQIALTVIFVAAMARIGWLGINESKAWNQALILNGRVVSIDPKPDRSGQVLFHVQFKDPDGRKQAAILERADFYIEPRELGDEVTVYYVPGDPPRVKGPARARDAAFLHYMPRAAAIFAAYGITMAAAGWLPRRRKPEVTEGDDDGDPLVKQL